MQSAARVALGVGGTLVVGALFLFNPAGTQWMPGCPLHALTGWYCAGCGTTRALHELLHGHVGAAFALNPLTMSLVPVAGYVALRRRSVRLTGGWMLAVAGVAIVFAVARNVPVYPFTMLVPN